MARYISVPPDFTYIYALTCPFTEEVRYIGKADDPIVRLKRHRGSPRGSVRRWIWELQQLAQQPNMIVLGVCPNSAWPSYEKWWIAKYRKLGANLLNFGSGGGGTNGAHHWRKVSGDG